MKKRALLLTSICSILTISTVAFTACSSTSTTSTTSSTSVKEYISASSETLALEENLDNSENMIASDDEILIDDEDLIVSDTLISSLPHTNGDTSSLETGAIPEEYAALLKMLNNAAAKDLSSIRHSMTKSVPENYLAKSKNAGKIITMSYKTKDRITNENLTKSLQVYLPYNYDESKTYDVNYAMHGLSGNSKMMFQSKKIVNLFDNLISHGDIKPTIVITPSFTPNDENLNLNDSYNYVKVFYEELKNDIIPQIEGKLATHYKNLIDSAVSPNDAMKLTRENRSYGGFSMGGIETWFEICNNLDIISKFYPLSGDSWTKSMLGGAMNTKATVDSITNSLDKQDYKNHPFTIYTAVGTDDFMYADVINQFALLDTKTNYFNKDNLTLQIKEHGNHDLDAAVEYIYNAMIQ